MSAASATVQNIRVLLRRGHLRQAGSSALFAAVVLLLSGMILLGINVSTMRKNFEWVQQTDDVLQQISTLESGVTGVELTVRGYALTDDTRFLVFQRNNLHIIELAADKLAGLIAHSPSQLSQFAALRQTVDVHCQLFTALTGLGPGHAREVAAAIVNRKYRDVMDKLRGQLSAFRQEERQLLVQRQETATAQASRTYDIAIGIVLTAFVLGVLGIVLAQSGRDHKIRTAL